MYTLQKHYLDVQHITRVVAEGRTFISDDQRLAVISYGLFYGAYREVDILLCTSKKVSGTPQTYFCSK